MSPYSYLSDKIYTCMKNGNTQLTHTTDCKNIIHLITKPLRISTGMIALLTIYISLNAFRFNRTKQIKKNLLCCAYKHLTNDEITKTAVTFPRKIDISYIHETTDFYNAMTKLTHVFEIT